MRYNAHWKITQGFQGEEEGPPQVGTDRFGDMLLMTQIMKES